MIKKLFKNYIFIIAIRVVHYNSKISPITITKPSQQRSYPRFPITISFNFYNCRVTEQSKTRLKDSFSCYLIWPRHGQFEFNQYMKRIMYNTKTLLLTFYYSIGIIVKKYFLHVHNISVYCLVSRRCCTPPILSSVTL